MTTDASGAYLLARLGVIDARIRAAVGRRRAGDPEPDDPVRGLYVSEQQVDDLMAGSISAGFEPVDGERVTAIEAEGDSNEEDGHDIRLRRLGRTFALDRFDLDVMLLAIAPDLDQRYERLYGYLHDDITRRRASIGLALELIGGARTAAHERGRFSATSPMVAARCIQVEELDRPFLTRSLRVPDRVVAFLLGDDAPDPDVDALMVQPRPLAVPETEVLAAALIGGEHLAFVRDRPGAAGRASAEAAVERIGLQPLSVDLRRLARDADIASVAALVLREARLTGRGLVVDGVDALEHPGEAVRVLASGGHPTVLVGADAWDPTWSDSVPLLIDAQLPDASVRTAMWEQIVGEGSLDFDPATATAQFRLRPVQAWRAVKEAQLHAAATGTEVDPAALRAGARSQNAGKLEHLSRRVEPEATFTDLVLPARVLALLREIVDRTLHRDVVLDTWGMASRAGRGRGITALFAGESGTGKTLSAEVIAGALGLDLYTIDLSTVVDKYVGETEKNLERIFAEAEGVNGVLFFDEADALFGKRSEVSDARDRYANVEIAFLLQRMEYFDGIAILATNLRANLDEAFTRRIDVLVDFPEPEEDDRLRLWELHLPASVPRDDDIDLAYLAKAFRIAGGDVRNVTVAAAYAAAVDGRSIGMEHLVRATAREYRKLGRLITPSEFGPYFDLVNDQRLDDQGDDDGHT